MKKFRMMLPVLAVVFAVGAAVAGNFFAPITAYYKQSPTVCQSGTTNENNCQVSSNLSYPICTINVAGSPQAFSQLNCTGVLRDLPQ